MSELKTKLNKALHGIDLDQCESDTGYWETSCGVEFGKSVLIKVNNIADEYESQLAEAREYMEEHDCLEDFNEWKNR